MEANSSTELACSVAPCERACAPAATCSEALATCSADKFISEKSPLKEFIILSKDILIDLKSPINSWSISTLKSPFAILVNVLSIRYLKAYFASF